MPNVIYVLPRRVRLSAIFVLLVVLAMATSPYSHAER